MNAFAALRKRERLLYIGPQPEEEARSALASCLLPLAAQAEFVTAGTAEEIEIAIRDSQYTAAIVDLPHDTFPEPTAARLNAASVQNRRRLILVVRGRAQTSASKLFSDPFTGMYAGHRELASTAVSAGYLLWHRGGTLIRHQSSEVSWLVLKHQREIPKLIGIRGLSTGSGQPAGEPPHPKPEKKSFFTKVAGVSHQNSDGSSRQHIIRRHSKGDLVRFVREPENPYDHRAVKVLAQDGKQIGYLGANIVGNDQGIGWSVAKEMDKGRIYHAVIANITGRGRETRGVNLKVSFWSGPIDEARNLSLAENSVHDSLKAGETLGVGSGAGCLILLVLACAAIFFLAVLFFGFSSGKS